MRATILPLAALATLALIAGACRTAEPVSPPLPSGGASTPSGDVPVAEAFAEGGALFVPAETVLAAQREGVDILLVDARTPLDFSFSHIPGSVNVPYFEPEKHVDALPRDRWIVTYCECPHAEAQQLADFLAANGFSKLRVINEGLQGWRDAGGPVEEAGEPAGGTSGAPATPSPTSRP